MSDPWVRLVRNARDGKGVRLTAAELARVFCMDHAITEAALSCTTECTCDLWSKYQRLCTYCEERGTNDPSE